MVKKAKGKKTSPFQLSAAMAANLPSASTSKQKTRYIAIDYGLKRVGLACSDERHLIALPWQQLPAARTAVATAERLATAIQKDALERSYTVEKCLVGLPLSMDGTHSLFTDEVRFFLQFFRPLVTYPIIEWDERLTSRQAERSLQAQGFSRKQRTSVVDAAAAVLILQSYLDALSIASERCKQEELYGPDHTISSD